MLIFLGGGWLGSVVSCRNVPRPLSPPFSLFPGRAAFHTPKKEREVFFKIALTRMTWFTKFCFYIALKNHFIFDLMCHRQ